MTTPPDARPALRRRVRGWLERLPPGWWQVGRGRAAGVLLLLGLLAPMLAFESRPELAVRGGLFDLYQQLFPRQRIKDGVVVVAIDDYSLAQLGQWPWPRWQLAQLIERIAAEKPAAIGIDFFFAEPDRLSPSLQTREWVRSGLMPDSAALAQLPNYDAQLAAAIARAPVVLGVAGLASDPGLVRGNDYRPLIRQYGGDASAFAPRFPASLRSIPLIDAAALGHGVFNRAGEMGVVRQVPTLVLLGDTLQAGFAVETLRLAAGEEQLRVKLLPDGIAAVAIADRVIPTDASGQWWLHYSHAEQRPHISAAKVFSGDQPPGLFTGRIVLLGYTALGLQDIIATPLGNMPGVEAHAEAIDNFLDGELLTRPRWAARLEAGLLVALALLAVVLVPWLGPGLTTVIFFAVVLLVLGLGLLAFVGQAWLIDTANPVLQASVVFAAVLALSLAEAQKQRGRLRLALTSSRESQARLEGELDAARRIQMGMLPVASEVLGGEQRVEIGALMRPARTVGGDLYDFFRLDGSRLFFMVGDVSGKGLPASLFMALAKALTKGAALRADGDPARALREASAAIGRENPEFLFVSMLAGVLDLADGRLRWCNAGHEAPFLLAAGAQVPQRLDGEGGPPLCVMDGYEYRNETSQLGAGDALCIVTDGVTEAEDARLAFYGVARLQACLAQAMQAGAQELVEAIAQDVERFAAGVEQADDLTVLVLRWRGP